MRFLVDAQLPRRLVSRLRDAGHEATHTLDLPLGNSTPDYVINELSIHEGYIVITKDADFVNSFLLHQRPHKLLLISTGNIRNLELELLLMSNLENIAEKFETFDFIEIDRKVVIFHL
jgi:predicted nuclease of predicted toxin-antitoxin system